MKQLSKILIVDDIELNRAILGELFRDRYEVLEAENGIQAIEMIKKYGEAIVVVLLDIIMPVMDGFGVLKYVEESKFANRIPIVMITAETSTNSIQKCFGMGAREVISKPFAPSVIQQRISNIVEQYAYKLNLEKLVDEQTYELKRQANKLRENTLQIIDILSAVIEFKNTESVAHIQNIRTMTRVLLYELAGHYKQIELTDEMVYIISESAAMHDIGKVAIPDSILNKPGKLTKEEFEVMKTHTIKGCEILDKLSSVQHLEYYDYCYDICRHHHERWDGKGYPDGLVGDEISLWAQVVSLVDVYDALTNKRVYKEAYTPQKAVQMIVDGECGVFNPMLIESFLSLIKGQNYDLTALCGATDNISNMVREQSQSSKFEYNDLTARTLRLLEIERQKYTILSQLSGEILFEYDYKTDILKFSERYHHLTGNNVETSNFINTLRTGDIISQEDYQRLVTLIKKPDKQSYKLEMQIKLTDVAQWYELYMYPLWDTDYEAKCIGCMGKIINIEERKQANLRLIEEANKDALTNILNRKALQNEVTKYIKANPNSMGALCFIDIDNFKKINDTYGHLVGDAKLKYVAKVLTDNIRALDFVGRIGGDEFVMFFKDVCDKSVLDRVYESISREFSPKRSGYDLSISMGIACYPLNGKSFDKLLLCADQALYAAKKSGKNQYRFFCDLNDKGE